MKKSKLLDRLLKFLFIPKCVSCHARLSAEAEEPLCNKCREKWENEKLSLCPKCGQQIEKCWCGIMDDRDGVIEREVHLAAYTQNPESVGRRMILSSKYRYNVLLFDMLADELAKVITRLGFEENTILVYVPRSKRNLKKFGHDQSKEIAKRLSRKTGILLVECLINKGKIQQKTLTHAKRTENAKHSFIFDKEMKNSVMGKNVILFDDLVTTGATVTRCAVLLKRYRANSVCVLSVGKTAT